MMRVCSLLVFAASVSFFSVVDVRAQVQADPTPPTPPTPPSSVVSGPPPEGLDYSRMKLVSTISDPFKWKKDPYVTTPTGDIRIEFDTAGTLRFVRVRTKRTLAEFRKLAVVDLALSGNGEVLATGSNDGTTRLWRVKDFKILHQFHGGNRVYFHSGDQILVTSGSATRVWRVSDGKLLLDSRTQSPYFCLSPDENWLVTWGEKDYSVWRLSDGQLQGTDVQNLQEKFNPVFSDDSQKLATVNSQQALVLWRLKGGQLVRIPLKMRTDGHLFFSPDSQMLAAQVGNNVIQLWRTVDGQVLSTLKGSKAYIFVFQFSPDSQFVAATITAGMGTDAMELWRTRDGVSLATMSVPNSNVQRFDFSPDGKVLATSSDDNIVRIWGVPSGKYITSRHVYPDPTGDVIFSPDSRIVASIAADKVLDLWRVDNGELVARLKQPRRVYGCLFTPDGRTLEVACEGVEVKWQVPASAQ